MELCEKFIKISLQLVKSYLFNVVFGWETRNSYARIAMETNYKLFYRDSRDISNYRKRE